MGEFDWIERVAAQTALQAPRPDVLIGIGDDAAVLRPPAGHQLLLTTDMLVEDVHFVAAGLDPADLGWKSIAVSVSDIAAMGGRAAHAVLSVAFRPDQIGEFADRLLAGCLDCASRYGVALVGGDTTATSGARGPLVVNVALTGFVRDGGAVTRSGARPGDVVCVTGALGGSILGRHLRVQPRQVESLSLVERCSVHAMIDLSDGLSSDLGHIVDASRVGAELWADRIPVHADARRLSAADGRNPLEHALHDGEDFELCFTVAADDAARLAAEGLCGTPVTPIGRIVAERERYALLPHADSPGPGAALPRRGHDHFPLR